MVNDTLQRSDSYAVGIAGAMTLVVSCYLIRAMRLFALTKACAHLSTFVGTFSRHESTQVSTTFRRNEKRSF